MQIGIRRVILFVEDVPKLTEFYERKLGLKVALRTPEFVDFEAGGCHLALHKGTPRPGRTKICFYAADVSKARAELVARGIEMGKDPGPGEGIKLCDGKDPEGNPFQLSNR
jgi:catechol 2,3-dioxygenase-like lactoylglutathione lyase family enzyme